MGVALHFADERGLRMNPKVTVLLLQAILLLLLPSAAFASRDAHLCAAPGGARGCFPTIQSAIDAAPMGATIDVYPGQYTETAPGRFVQGRGPYQFGIFVSEFKNGLTIQGVDDKGHRIHDYRRVQAFITTVATNDFGPSGTFVEGDSVTLQGLSFGRNLTGQNKTIEVIGDDFTLADSDIADQLGSVFINDFRFDENSNTSHVRSYTIDGNNFQDGVSLDLANGAGFSGEVNRRRIVRNDFTQEFDWPSISFNGSGTDISFFVHSVGGAVIKHNSFVNTHPDPTSKKAAHIRARGEYANSQFNWGSYWRNNKYNRAWVVGPNPPNVLRAYVYTDVDSEGKTLTFRNVRRIGISRLAEQLNAQPGDRVIGKGDGDNGRGNDNDADEADDFDRDHDRADHDHDDR
jgi:hypothetical protein